MGERNYQSLGWINNLTELSRPMGSVDEITLLLAPYSKKETVVNAITLTLECFTES